jgi:hypothetical protein
MNQLTPAVAYATNKHPYTDNYLNLREQQITATDATPLHHATTKLLTFDRARVTAEENNL